MKKFAYMLFLITFLVGCASTSTDNFSAYKSMTSQQIFDNGEKALAQGKYAEAVKNFEALDALYPFGPNAEQGQLDVIYAYYKSGDPASALAAADRYIRLYPRGEHVDYAYYMKGLVNYQMGFTWLQRSLGSDPAPHDLTNKKQAFQAFNMLVTLFPDSRYTPDALQRMGYIRNLFARKNVIIARYYMKRKAYVAAANRASYVVQHFDRSPEVIPALVIMVKAYRALGLTKMVDSTLHIFAASYPNAPQLKSLLRV